MAALKADASSTQLAALMAAASSTQVAPSPRVTCPVPAHLSRHLLPPPSSRQTHGSGRCASRRTAARWGGGNNGTGGCLIVSTCGNCRQQAGPRDQCTLRQHASAAPPPGFQLHSRVLALQPAQLQAPACCVQCAGATRQSPPPCAPSSRTAGCPTAGPSR